MAGTGDYEVIIIGAGLGGLACAAMLAQRGKRVLVLERSSRLGGRCSSYERRLKGRALRLRSSVMRGEYARGGEVG
jgi:phytoene dehydrogenase-like protein